MNIRVFHFALALGVLICASRTAVAQQLSLSAPIDPLTTREQIEVKQQLDAFERGEVGLDKASGLPDSCDKVVGYYGLHTNDISVKAKLPISRSFAMMGKYPEAAKLAQEYVNVYSNDWHGWRVIGVSKTVMGSYGEAITALTNAARLGDDKNYAGLGQACLAAKRPDIFERIAAPHLLVMMNDTNGFKDDERLEMRQMLILYSLINDNKKEIFVKAVGGLTRDVIMSDEELKNRVAYGCEIYNGNDIDEIRKRFGLATRGDSILSNSNSLSN